MPFQPRRSLLVLRYQVLLLQKHHTLPPNSDAEAAQAPETIRRLLLCSGKVYVDLVTSELHKQTDWVAIARVEQLYPFPADHLDALFKRYPNVQEIVWVQEEPVSYTHLTLPTIYSV